MKKSLIYVVFSAIAALGFAPATVLAKQEAPIDKADKIVLVAEDFNAVKKAAKAYGFSVDSVLMKKTLIAAVKKTPAVGTVAADAISIPSTAYMQALEKAQTAYLKARARANTKKKLEDAETAYTQAVEEATNLYLIPIEEQS